MENLKGRMTGPQFRTLKTKMALRSKEIGTLLGIRPETIWRWECGRVPVPESAEMVMNELASNPDQVEAIRANRYFQLEKAKQQRNAEKLRQKRVRHAIGVDMGQLDQDRSATVQINSETSTATELEPGPVMREVTDIQIPVSIPELESDDSGLNPERITAINTPQGQDHAQSGFISVNKTQHINAELIFKGKTIKPPPRDSALRLSVPDGISIEDTLQILKQLIASIEGLNLEAADPREVTVVVQLM